MLAPLADNGGPTFTHAITRDSPAFNTGDNPLGLITDQRIFARRDRSPSVPAPPGVDIGAGLHACQPGDTSPPGTIAQGMRKLVTKTPFGDTCRWELLK